MKTTFGRRTILATGAAALACPAALRGQARGGDAVLAIVQAPPSLDAQVTSAQAARNVNLHIYETLFARDENARPVPDLAAGVRISEDGRTYVFPLRGDVRFHNGKRLEAEDVVASLERYRRIGASASLLAAIDTVTATRRDEVTIRLKEVQATFLDNLSSPRAPIAIYPAEEAAKPANQIAFIGTGPFRFVEYRPDSHVRLERFGDYVPNPNARGRDGFAGRKEVTLNSATFRFMPEAGARTAALEAGEIHFVESVDGPTARRLQGNPRLAVYRALPFAFQVIKFNHALGPTADVRFRRALIAALDLEEIMAVSFPDIFELDGAWIFPGTAFHTREGTERYNRPDPALARRLLAEAGYRGERLTFIVDNLRSNVDTATVVQQRARDVGVAIDLSVSDWPTVSRIGFTPTGWHFWAHGFGIEPFEGPGSVMAPWVNGLSQQRPDPAIDAMFAELNRTLDEGGRRRIFARFQAHMWEQAVAIKAGNYGLFQAATARLRDFVPYRIPRMWGVRLDA